MTLAQRVTTEMGSTVGHRIDCNGVGGSERPAAHTQQNLTQVPPGLQLQQKRNAEAQGGGGGGMEENWGFGSKLYPSSETQGGGLRQNFSVHLFYLPPQ